MALPEIRPIRTTDVVLYEITPTETDYQWRPVRRAGSRLCATVRALSFLEVREISTLEDAQARLDRIVDLGLKAASIDGEPLPLESIPYAHRQGLATVIFDLSVVGADPFGGPPVASQP